MADLITMPKMGFDMAEGTLVEWVKQEGDEVAESEVLAIIESDKANVEVNSFASGVIRQHLVAVGAVVPVGQAIAIVGTPDEDISQLLVGQAIPAAAAKSEVPPAVSAPLAAKTGEVTLEAASETEREADGRVLASPVARRMAQELGIELGQIQGSGPGERIIKSDVEAYLEGREMATPAAGDPSLTTPSQTPDTGEYRVEPATPMRKTISRRMVESKQQIPHFYVTMDVDMAAAMALRQELNTLVPEEEKISVNDLVVKATALALREYPRLNAYYAGHEIHIHNRINIGIAVSLENGLVTTVVKDCGSKPLAQIARESREMIGRVRQGRMQAEDMVGGTFTVSNLGMLGVEDFVAIISPTQQAGILAVGGIRRTPVVNEDGELVAGTRMKITISADHRVTDGVEAASYLKELKAVLEAPMRLLL